MGSNPAVRHLERMQLPGRLFRRPPGGGGRKHTGPKVTRGAPIRRFWCGADTGGSPGGPGGAGLGRLPALSFSYAASNVVGGTDVSKFGLFGGDSGRIRGVVSKNGLGAWHDGGGVARESKVQRGMHPTTHPPRLPELLSGCLGILFSKATATARCRTGASLTGCAGVVGVLLLAWLGTRGVGLRRPRARSRLATAGSPRCAWPRPCAGGKRLCAFAACRRGGKAATPPRTPGFPRSVSKGRPRARAPGWWTKATMPWPALHRGATARCLDGGGSTARGSRPPRWRRGADWCPRRGPSTSPTATDLRASGSEGRTSSRSPSQTRAAWDTRT